jgi:hypothetical protein
VSQVIFIAGAARSGSTLLGDILGAQPEVFNAGELSLFWRDAARGNACACGDPITECEFWKVVLARVQEETGLGSESYAELGTERARLSRTTRPRALTEAIRHPERRTASQQGLIAAYQSLLNGALEEARATYLVDSSKTVPALRFHELTAATPQILHMVRDPRAVAASVRGSKDIERGNADSLPPGGGVPTAVIRWLWTTSAIRAYRRGRDQHVVRYEILAADPERETRRLCELLGICFASRTVAGRTLTMTRADGHAAVGNPRRGNLQRVIAVDDRWRTQLSPTSARLIRGVTAPFDAFLR